ncbi:hypothetical protein QJS04_geneDACA002688 [Acorus gramineus]|uniref:Uncharacterized protein n=1 Tax=Acorus gramineus TaxID=55184 RepID=A0AAV9AP23_ACOGR|nr:hypothetical protein QJS04_geneDACA002688 [Acorus gramineus]
MAGVATRPPPPTFVPSPPPTETDHHGSSKLAAWSSVRQRRWEGELAVDGKIPLWLNGTYLRNGPGLWNVGEHGFRHLFDGLATLVRLHFTNSRLIMSHRQVESEAYVSAMKHNKLCFREFSEVPTPTTTNPLSFLSDLASLLSGASLTDNANTGVVLLGDGRVVCLTETTKGSIVIDPETLETLGRFEYSDGLGGLVHSAHPIVTRAEFLTLLPDLVRPGYTVVRMEAGSNERRVVGRADCRAGPTPGWVHSFPVTENYVVVPEMPLRYSARNLLRAEPTPLYKFDWCPKNGAYLHVMCKRTGKIVASVEVPLFVTFHFINAYEERDKEGRVTAIVADCCEHYANTEILDQLRLRNLRINQDYLGKKYRYAYACGARRPCNFPNTITKIDLVEKKANSWHEEGAVPSEPFFVARPGATKEDDGVVISIVSDKNGEGYALMLDGSTFEEIARAKFPYGLPYGLHGCWVPKK